MKKLLILVITFLLFGSSIANATLINFDNYHSSTDNDFANNFTDSYSFYTPSETGGITGGMVIPGDVGSYMNSVAKYNNPIQNSAGTTHQVSMSFLYDSSLAVTDPSWWRTTLQLNLNPDSDWNHHIFAGVRGYGTDLRLLITGYYDASFNNHPNKPTLSLFDNNWYDLVLTVNNVGGNSGLLDTRLELFNMGTTGIASPTLIDFDTLTTYDTYFASDSNLNLSFYSEQFGGTKALDNFQVSVPVPEPATMLLLGIGLAGLAGAEVRRRRKKKTVDKG